MSKFYTGINDRNADDDDIASDIISQHDDSVGQTETIRAEHERYMRAYLGKMPDLAPEFEGRSNLFVPLVEPLIDTIESKLFMTIMGHNPFIKYVPEDKDSILAARFMERLVKYLLVNKMPDGIRQIRMWIRQALISDIGILHIYFDTLSHTKSIDKIVPNPFIPNLPLLSPEGLPIIQPGVEAVIDYAGLRLEVIDLSRFAADWHATDFNQSWVSVSEAIDPELFITRVNSGEYPDIGEEGLEELISDPTSTASSYSQIGVTEPDIYSVTNRPKIELIQRYGKGWLNDERQDLKITVARKSSGKFGRILSKVPFGVKPFCLLRAKDKINQLIGRGITSQIIDLQDELIVTRNQRIDNIAFELNGGWIYSDGAVEDENQFVSKPVQLIKLTDPSQKCEKIVRQPLPPDSFIHEQTIQQEAMRVSASEDVLRGQMQRRETATVATLMNSNAGQRLEAMAYSMGNDGFRDLGNKLAVILTEYFPTSDKFTIRLEQDEINSFMDEVGPNDPRIAQYLDPQTGMIQVTPKDLLGKMFATASITALDGDNTVKSQHLLQLLQILQPYSQVGFKDKMGNIVYVDVWYILKEYARLNKIYDFQDMLVKIPAQVVAQQEAAKQAMMEQASQGAQGGPQQPKTSPAEVGGQIGLPKVQQQVDQKQGIIQLIEQSLSGGA